MLENIDDVNSGVYKRWIYSNKVDYELVCDYRIQNMMDRDSRHLYDIAKLLPEVEITPELDALIDRVRNDRMKSKNTPSAQLEYKK